MRTGSLSPADGLAAAATSGVGVILIDLICGGRFGIWYATLTSSITGEIFPASAEEKVSRYWRNRAGGEAMRMNSAAGTSSLQLLQLFCPESRTLPLRVATFN